MEQSKRPSTEENKLRCSKKRKQFVTPRFVSPTLQKSITSQDQSTLSLTATPHELGGPHSTSNIQEGMQSRDGKALLSLDDSLEIENESGRTRPQSDQSIEDINEPIGSTISNTRRIHSWTHSRPVMYSYSKSSYTVGKVFRRTEVERRKGHLVEKQNCEKATNSLSVYDYPVSQSAPVKESVILSDPKEQSFNESIIQYRTADEQRSIGIQLLSIIAETKAEIAEMKERYTILLAAEVAAASSMTSEHSKTSVKKQQELSFFLSGSEE